MACAKFKVSMPLTIPIRYQGVWRSEDMLTKFYNAWEWQLFVSKFIDLFIFL